MTNRSDLELVGMWLWDLSLVALRFCFIKFPKEFFITWWLSILQHNFALWKYRRLSGTIQALGGEPPYYPGERSRSWTGLEVLGFGFALCVAIFSLIVFIAIFIT